VSEQERMDAQDRLERARALVAHLEAGEEREAEAVLDELTRMRESDLFRELGRLTRELHEALKSFQLDARIAEFAEKEIPDAKERLGYVISMTEQAAHRTMDLVERSLPLTEGLARDGRRLAEEWGRFRARRMDAEAFRALARELDTFLPRVAEDAETVRGQLTEVLMAQDFQDLTGQIIRKVITLVQEVEGNLVELVRISGQRLARRGDGAGGKDAAEGKTSEGKTSPSGPHVPGCDGGDVVKGQDEVDDLLASLGF